MSCVTSGMRWTVNWRAATLHHAFLDHLESVVDDSVSTVILYRDGCCYQNRNVTLSNALIHFAVSRRKIIVQKFLEKGHTWMEVQSVHSATEGKLRGHQIFWPAEYIDVILLQEETILMKSNKWTTLSSETSLSWIVKQHSPRQQCWRSSSWTYGVCNTSRMVWWATISTALTSGDPYHKDGERTKLTTTRSPRCTRHPCASRAPNGSIFSSWRKYCPKTTITYMMHCLMETGYWTQEPRQFWFQGRQPWTSKEHAQQSKD